jgi:hypothetical protein
LDFRGREPTAPLGIGKPSRGEPIPSKYKAPPSIDETPRPEPRRFLPQRAKSSWVQKYEDNIL